MLNHIENFLRSNFFVAIIVTEFASLHDKVIDLEFSGCSLDDFLFDRSLCDKSVNYNISLLTNSVSSINSLEVNLRIPIRVKYDYDIGLMEIDTNTTSSG